MLNVDPNKKIQTSKTISTLSFKNGSVFPMANEHTSILTPRASTSNEPFLEKKERLRPVSLMATSLGRL